MTLIDTSCWIEFLRKNGNPMVKGKVASFIERGQAAYCGPIQFELVAGAREQELPFIREALRFSASLDFTTECWELAGHLERSLRPKSITIPRDDLFVAAAALHHDRPLYAVDHHSAMIRDTVAPTLKLA